MKGIVFTEFFALVEEKFGIEMVDEIIDSAELSSGGSYTSVGSYSHHELLSLVTILSEKTNISVEDLVKVFGEYLLNSFKQKYPDFFTGVDNCFDFLETIENHIHVEVKKLYPDADLPTFDSSVHSDKQTMTLMYYSTKPFSALAYGLIKGSAHYYGEDISIHMNDMSTSDMTKVEFTLIKNS